MKKWKISVRTWPAVFLLSLSLMSTAGARIITVDDDGPADFNNIQPAINDANDGDTVEIKPGTYTGPGNYNIRFNGKAITVRGSNPDDFDVVAATVMDCNSQGCGFIFESGEDPNSVLSGLKITGGYASFPGGGAIRCQDSSPVISNCSIFHNNYSGYAIGGGIYIRYGQPLIKNCVISHNTAYNGGGIYVSHGTSGATIQNCIIAGNTAMSEPSGQGGGIYTSYASKLTITDSTITGNRSGDRGGGIRSSCPRVEIRSCTITANVAGNAGGGICAVEWNETAISNSIVSNNNAPLGTEVALHPVLSDSSATVSISYSNIAGGQLLVHVDPYSTLNWGPGNIDVDPCFADPGYWGHIADPNIHVEPNDPNATWVDGGGDYHLKSQAGRWDANEGGPVGPLRGWTIDEVTSLCIDAGDPNFPLGPEPFPNGGKINIGAYGGTAEASKSYFNKPPCETIVAGDINGDCIIDGRDFALLARNWLISDLQPPSPWRPGRATDPDPADGAIDPPGSGHHGSFLLSWQAGHRAESHDVYFGTVSPGDFRGNQTETEFHPGIAFTSGTYYWRIDEINTYGKTTGAVWTFSISPPAPATNPSPADGTIGFCSRTGTFYLSWTPGDRARTHDVYFGTVSPGEFHGNQTSTTFSLGPALLSNTYYWRIDEISGNVKTTGPLWTFTVQGPPAATNPYPADGAEPNSVPLILSWQPGEGAETYDVYLGTESPGAFQGNQTETIFDPGTLKAARTYYWRIDEIGHCGKTIGTVWTFKTPPPDPATHPYPVDGGIYTSTAVTLSWQAGAGAETHDVYFGTESPGEFQGNQAATTITPPALEAQKIYYWRIDEIGGDSKTVGSVWTFTVSLPTPATNPYPADGATNVYPDTQGNYSLRWQPGNYTWSHDVYFGTESPGEFHGYYTSNTFNLGPALPFNTYYWRIDEINGAGKTIGTVWSFRISPPDAPTDPYPADEATYTSASVTLSWQPGAGAQTHDVYFGTESPGEFQGNQTATTFRPGPLEAQKTYYWRIDEVNAYGKTTGPVWQFTCMPAR